MGIPLCCGRLEGMLPILCDFASGLLNNRSTYDMYHQVAITYPRATQRDSGTSPRVLRPPTMDTRARRQAIADSFTRGEGHAAYASDGDRAVTSALLDMAIDRPLHTTGKDG